MKTMEVIKMGNPLLRQISKEVDVNEIKEESFQRFLDELIETMRFNNGAGIAAPQVGILQRVFTMEMNVNPRYPDKESFPLYVVINPSIEFLDDIMVDSWEGCLSIPNIRGQLKRYKRVKLSGLDRKGSDFEVELDGFAAIVAQHELDHLDGTLLIDRMESMKTLTFQEEYEKFWL